MRAHTSSPSSYSLGKRGPSHAPSTGLRGGVDGERGPDHVALDLYRRHTAEEQGEMLTPSS